MIQKGYYCYKWVNNGEIIYIGKTTEPIRRIKQEKNDNRFRGFADSEIYVLRLNNLVEMDFMEKLLINHYLPLLNKVCKSEVSSDFPICFDALEWITYEEFEYQLDITDDKDKRIIELENKLEYTEHRLAIIQNSQEYYNRIKNTRNEKLRELKNQLNDYYVNNELLVRGVVNQLETILNIS